MTSLTAAVHTHTYLRTYLHVHVERGMSSQQLPSSSHFSLPSSSEGSRGARRTPPPRRIAPLHSPHPFEKSAREKWRVKTVREAYEALRVALPWSRVERGHFCEVRTLEAAVSHIRELQEVMLQQTPEIVTEKPRRSTRMRRPPDRLY